MISKVCPTRCVHHACTCLRNFSRGGSPPSSMRGYHVPRLQRAASAALLHVLMLAATSILCGINAAGADSPQQTSSTASNNTYTHSNTQGLGILNIHQANAETGTRARDTSPPSRHGAARLRPRPPSLPPSPSAGANANQPMAGTERNVGIHQGALGRRRRRRRQGDANGGDADADTPSTLEPVPLLRKVRQEDACDLITRPRLCKLRGDCKWNGKTKICRLATTSTATTTTATISQECQGYVTLGYVL